MRILGASKEDFLDLITAHIKNTNTFKDYNVRPKLKFECNGKTYELSIQASNAHYSSPRDSHSEYYEEVELGFPNFLFSDGFIKEYAEDKDDAKESVYPYVPLEELAIELALLVKGEIR